jgi:TolB-like protein
MSLFAEFKRRNVFKVGIAYTVASWLTLQVIDVLFPLLSIPEWIARALLLIVVIGFPFALIFAWAYELTPDGIKRDDEVDRSTSTTHLNGRRLDFIIIAILVVALGFFVFDKFVARSDVIQVAGLNRPSPVGQKSPQSVAVLPFVDLSLRQNDSLIGETIAAEMQTELLRRSELRVLSRSTTLAIPVEYQSSQEVGKHLGVDILVEGTFRRVGDRIRVTVQLVAVADGYQLWSDVYEDRLRDDFSAEVAVAEYFSSQVRNRLSGPLTRSEGSTRFAELSDRGFSDLFAESANAAFPSSMEGERLDEEDDSVE